MYNCCRVGDIAGATVVDRDRLHPVGQVSWPLILQHGVLKWGEAVMILPEFSHLILAVAKSCMSMKHIDTEITMLLHAFKAVLIILLMVTGQEWN